MRLKRLEKLLEATNCTEFFSYCGKYNLAYKINWCKTFPDIRAKAGFHLVLMKEVRHMIGFLGLQHITTGKWVSASQLAEIILNLLEMMFSHPLKYPEF